MGSAQPPTQRACSPGHDTRCSLAWLWIWAKTDRFGLSRKRGNSPWNTLLAHCLDTAAVCGALFDHYLAAPVRARLADAFGAGDVAKARSILMFLAATHDMPGKAIPDFQLGFLQSRDPELLAHARHWLAQAQSHGLPLDSTHRTARQHAHVTARYLPGLLGCTCCTDDEDETGPEHHGLHAIAALLGGHHGHVPNSSCIGTAECDLTPAWKSLQRELLNELARLLDVDLTELPALVRPERPCVLPLFAGLVVHSDWIASDESRFTYRTPETAGTNTDLWWRSSREEAAAAIRDLRLHRWQPTEMTWAEQMPDTPQPRPAQKAVIDARITGQSLVIIEDTTGGGKTEIAQYLTHRLALTCGYHGAYIALPLRAASDQIARRYRDYLTAILGSREAANLAVVHGSAHISEINRELKEASSANLDPSLINITNCDDPDTHQPASVVLHTWYEERSRGLLSCFGVGTIDQLVLAPQKSRHWFLRLYGLVNKTVVIDEAHAYELYQQQLLGAAIAWLADAGSSVVILSATLPKHQRHALLAAWCSGLQTQPSTPNPTGPITIVDSQGRCRTLTSARSKTSRKHRTRIRLMADPGPEALAHHLLTQHTTGITTVIRNTFIRAEALHDALLDQAEKQGWKPEEILLLHGRFFEKDRAHHQATLEAKLGPHPDPAARATTANPDRPERLLLIGTQVLEASLDYCTDHLYTDLCPFDLLLQRRGRQWRHTLNRPRHKHLAPLTHVLWTPNEDGLPCLPRPGTPGVYDPYILAATWHALHQHMPAHAPLTLTLTSPTDTQPILNTLYGDPPPDGQTPIHHLLRTLYPHWQRRLRDERKAAEGRELWPYDQNGNPTTYEELASGPSHGAGDDPDHPAHLAARSRLGTPSIDVIGLYQHPDRITWDPAGHEPADLRRYHPYADQDQEAHRLQRRHFLLNTVHVPHYWIGDLPNPTTWTKPEPAPALTDRPTLLLTPDGSPLDGRLAHLTYTPQTGLSRRRRPQPPVTS
ncbi:CRISPR-associated helicase Cas3' [Streptomyces goshikiensis]|uniref:CRISPR-associated helicase Cas3 n=1 Tax=Streptomyces goshikiensis TaxID=1942 RepID=A0ABZ1RDD9_9ACTN|nr:CRISPR-associated helicase Cas3' [Streptomyces goshikiensis]